MLHCLQPPQKNKTWLPKQRADYDSQLVNVAMTITPQPQPQPQPPGSSADKQSTFSPTKEQNRKMVVSFHAEEDMLICTKLLSFVLDSIVATKSSLFQSIMDTYQNLLWQQPSNPFFKLNISLSPNNPFD